MLHAPQTFQQELYRPFHKKTVRLMHSARVTVKTGWMQCERLAKPSKKTQFTQRDSMTSFLNMLLKFYRGTANNLAYVDAFKYFAMEAFFQQQELHKRFQSMVEEAPWPESDVMSEIMDVLQESLAKASNGKDITLFYLTHLRELMPLLGFLGAQDLHKTTCGLGNNEINQLKLLQTLAASFLQALVEFAVNKQWLRAEVEKKHLTQNATIPVSKNIYLSVLNKGTSDEDSEKFFIENKWILSWLGKADFGKIHQRVQDNISVITDDRVARLGLEAAPVLMARQLSWADKRKAPWAWQENKERQGGSVTRLFMQGTLTYRDKNWNLATYQLLKPSLINFMTVDAVSDEKKRPFFSDSIKTGLRRVGMVLLVGAAFAVPYVFGLGLMITGTVAGGTLLGNFIVDRVITTPCRDSCLKPT